jgi:hypothetical protein
MTSLLMNFIKINLVKDILMKIHDEFIYLTNF